MEPVKCGWITGLALRKLVGWGPPPSFVPQEYSPASGVRPAPISVSSIGSR